MPTHRDFKETVKARAARELAFREALLIEAAEQLAAIAAADRDGPPMTDEE